MDSDISNSGSDVLRNVVMGRVMEDGSWTEVGRFSDVKTVTFHGEEMPEEFTTKHLKPWDDVSFTARIEPTIVQQMIDNLYETVLKPTMEQIADQISKTVPTYILYANEKDQDNVEFIKSIWAHSSIDQGIFSHVTYSSYVPKGKVYLVPFSTSEGTFFDVASKKLEPFEKPDESPVRDISWIRKQLKHCKNPMERKQLEKELNAAFREKKKRRRKK